MAVDPRWMLHELRLQDGWCHFHHYCERLLYYDPLDSVRQANLVHVQLLESGHIDARNLARHVDSIFIHRQMDRRNASIRSSSNTSERTATLLKTTGTGSFRWQRSRRVAITSMVCLQGRLVVSDACRRRDRRFVSICCDDRRSMATRSGTRSQQHDRTTVHIVFSASMVSLSCPRSSS